MMIVCRRCSFGRPTFSTSTIECGDYTEEMKQVSLKVEVVFYVEIRVSEQAATSAATARSKLFIILPMHFVFSSLLTASTPES